ncbi:MAG TPA: hypothetical protein VFI25_16220 [Planctomycetota bacterium]|jgi:hypothetical protein|nr:hypothetical protein [Planctomycetota bacterium]
MALEVLRRYQRPILIGVTVFVLLTFSITGTMLLAFHKAEDLGIASFRLPSGKTFVVDRPTYQDYAYGCELTLGLLPFVRTRLVEADVYRFLLLHRLALESGLDVSKESIAEYLRAGMGFYFRTRDEYDRFLRRYRIRAPVYEEYVRRFLVVDRYLSFAGSAYAIPGPEDVEAAWRKEHARFTLEVVSFSSDAQAEESKRLLASDADLEAWRDALPPDRKKRYERDARTSFEGAAAAKADLAKPHPGPLADALAGIAFAEEEIVQRYDATKRARYRKPAPSPASEPASTQPASAPAEEFLPIEEVRDRVLAELRAAKLFEKVAREAGSEGAAPFAEVARKFGLETLVQSSVTPKELEALPRFSDPVARISIQTGPVGQVLPGPFFSEESAYMVRIVGREEAGQPRVSEIRDRLLEDWRKAKALEAAEKAAKAFKESVEGRKEPDAFALEAAAKGLPPARIGPVPLYARRLPEYAKLPEGAQKFLEGAPHLYAEVETGKLAGPFRQDLGEDKGTFHVVRVAERTEPDPSGMRAFEYRSAWESARRDRVEEFYEKVASFDALKEKFAFQFSRESPRPGT